VSLRGRPLLGVSLSGLIQAKYEARNPRAKQAPFVRTMAGLLDRVAGELGCDVLFVAHVTGPSRSKDDRLVARRVADAMRQKSWVLRADYKPEELKGVIARTDLFFGARMHANIAALSSAVPTVAIAYSHKTQGIMDSLGQQERVMDIRRDDLEAGVPLLLSTWQDRERVRAALNENVEPLRTLSRENISLLLDVLQRT
jgi:colanic acid/amylovoran biosynthesis protein